VTKRDTSTIHVWRVGVGFFVLFVISFVVAYIGAPSLGEVSVTGVSSPATTTPIKRTIHVTTPTAVKGIYMTACVASNTSLRAKLISLIDDTELNTVVIDIKSFDGYLSFVPDDKRLASSTGGDCVVRDMREFLETLHAHDIYVAGRVAVFQDGLMVKMRPELAVKKASDKTVVWRDYKGIPWIDVGAEAHWNYIVSIAKEAYNLGFDEINFDYIRFPSDGNTADIYYPWSTGKKKPDIIESFFAYLRQSLDGTGIVMSADLFGMTTTNEDDLNIGQVIEKALPYFDYIAPMVYPSHYPYNFNNGGDPNKDPYGVVHYSMSQAVVRVIATTTPIETIDSKLISTTTHPWLYSKPAWNVQKLRPWLQDNNYPVPYTAEMVRAQIQATYDAGLTSWMLWNAGNRYTRDALLLD
jgi:hypothetical protein